MISHGDFGFVVKALNDARKWLLSAEVVEDQFAMPTQGAGDLFHGLDPGPQDLAAPFVEELASPGGRVVIPELLKGFLQKVSADSLQVAAEQFARPEALFDLQILVAHQQHPARFLQHGTGTFGGHAARFAGVDLIESFVHLSHDVEPVEDVQSLGAFFADELQVRLPHVGADENDLRGDFFTDDGEKSLERFGGSFLPDLRIPDRKSTRLNSSHLVISYAVFCLKK